MLTVLARTEDGMNRTLKPLRPPAESASEADPPQRNVIPPGHSVPAFLVHRLNQVCLGILAEVWDPADLTRIEYATLTNLDAAPGIDQKTLGERLGIDKASTSQTVDRLVRRGLVDRRVDEANRRTHVLDLTPAGLELRRRLHPAAREANERILAPLRPEERAVLIDLMVRVIEGHGVYARPGNNRRPRKRKRPAEP